MARRSLWAVVGAVVLGAAVALPIATASAGTVDPKAPTNPYGDPNLVSIFDGKTLTGWTASNPGNWVVKNSTIHLNGNARGWLYYNKQVDTFRWIFQVRHLTGDHKPTVLIWGSINRRSGTRWTRSSSSRRTVDTGTTARATTTVAANTSSRPRTRT